MTSEERQDLIATLRKYKASVTSSKKKSQDFLIKAGIFTPKGRLSKKYNQLCIPENQD